MKNFKKGFFVVTFTMLFATIAMAQGDSNGLEGFDGNGGEEFIDDGSVGFGHGNGSGTSAGGPGRETNGDRDFFPDHHDGFGRRKICFARDKRGLVTSADGFESREELSFVALTKCQRKSSKPHSCVFAGCRRQ